MQTGEILPYRNLINVTNVTSLLSKLFVKIIENKFSINEKPYQNIASVTKLFLIHTGKNLPYHCSECDKDFSVN